MNGPILRRPSALVHAVWICVLLAILALLAGATLVQVDKVVRAEGQVRTEEHSAHVVSPVSGRIQAVHVDEGDAVRKGDRLLTIEPDANGLSIHQARLNMVRFASEYEAYSGAPALLQAKTDAEALAYRIVRNGAAAELRAAQARRTTVEKELAESQSRVEVEGAALGRQQALEPIVVERLERHTELVRNGFQSPVSLLSMTQEAIDAREQVAIARRRLARAREEVKLREAALVAASTDLDRLKMQRTAEAYSHFQQAEADVMRLTDLSRNSAIDSPVDGVIEHLSEQVAGNAVRAGERLMSVVPTETRLELQLRVRNEDYPFVKPGQEVNVKFDAYPFTIYGSRPAVVIRVLREVLPSESGLSDYVAIAQLQAPPPEQPSMVIRRGMKLIADIEVGHQRPIDIWLDPFLRFGNEAFRESR